MASFATQKNRDFFEEAFTDYPLDRAVEWIANNLDPAEVFTKEQLAEWAIDNGYVEEEA